jgi:hypothetical protein
MNCPKCGASISDGSESCPSCGVILSRIHAEPRPKPELPRFSVQLDKKDVRDVDEAGFVEWTRAGHIKPGTFVFDRTSGGDWKPAGTFDVYRNNTFTVSTGDIDMEYDTIDIVTGSSQLQFSGLTAIDADKTYRVALANMVAQARSLGADGVVWITFRTIPGQALSLMFVVASGTAIQMRAPKADR